MGLTSNNLSLYAQCPIATINSPNKQSYFEISYDNTLITVHNTSTCIASTTNGTITTCTITIPSNTANINNTIRLTNIYTLISSTTIITNISIKIKSWSYYSSMLEFYPVC